MLSAQMIGQTGLHDAMHLCGQARWPFYSTLIYGLAYPTHFLYVTAAYILDGLFSACSVITFILIVKTLGGSQRVLWLATGVILLSHEFNSVRQYIIRDHGFWAFYLLSLFCLLHYFRHPRWLVAWGFSISLAVATLFRIEGAIFLLMLPFLSWVALRCPFRMRAICFLTLYLPVLIIAFAIGIWLLLHPQQTLAQLGRIGEVVQQIHDGLLMVVTNYQSTKTALATHVLSQDSISDAGLVLLVTMVGWYLMSVINNLSWIYSCLTLYAWRRKTAIFAPSAKWVLGGYIFVNVLITFGFLLEHLFLSKRYLIALSLIFMLWVPFALDDLLQRGSSPRYRKLFLLSVLLIVITSLGGFLNFGHSKKYIREAGDWLADHLPPQAMLYANDDQLMYYSQHFGTQIFDKMQRYHHLDIMANDQWKQYDYIALRVNQKDKDSHNALQNIPLSPVQVFNNGRGDAVIIYAVHPEAKT